MKLRSPLLATALFLGSLAFVSTATPATAAPGPVNLLKPTIAGTPMIDKTLIATQGLWTGVGVRAGATPTTYTFQWLRDGVEISGATHRKYTATIADRSGWGLGGARLSVQVTAHKTGHEPVTATSAPTGPVKAGRFVPGQPSISGINRVGSTLTFDPGDWQPDVFFRWFEVSWYANNTLVQEPCRRLPTPCMFPAEQYTYTPTLADRGKLIRAVVLVTALDWYVPARRVAFAGPTQLHSRAPR